MVAFLSSLIFLIYEFYEFAFFFNSCHIGVWARVNNILAESGILLHYDLKQSMPKGRRHSLSGILLILTLYDF